MDNAVNLFQKLNSKFLDLLNGFSSEQWNKNLSIGNKKVKDLAVQILDEFKHDLFQIIQKLDSKSFELSAKKEFEEPEYLSDLQVFNKYLNQYIDDYFVSKKNIEPKAEQINFSKIYAKNWVYQQKIRQVIGAPILLEAEFYHPFLEYCLDFLPQHFQNISAANDTIISIEIVSETTKTWQIIRRENSWHFIESPILSSTQVYIDQNIAWILFSGDIDIYEASQYWQVIGNQDLGRHVLSMRPFE